MSQSHISKSILHRAVELRNGPSMCNATLSSLRHLLFFSLHDTSPLLPLFMAPTEKEMLKARLILAQAENNSKNLLLS